MVLVYFAKGSPLQKLTELLLKLIVDKIYMVYWA